MRPLLLGLLAALALLLPGAASAEERILRFLSDVQIQQDGALLVEETIRVRSEGDSIQRGIFRDFPTRYRTGAGRELRVGFDVQEVERDGNPEPWTTESLSNGVRVRIGDADVLLPEGEHEYRIRYRTTRQLGYFPDFDELYWNVTGNGWKFPIDVAETRIRLPSPSPFGQRSVYTGPEGSTAKNAAVIAEEPGEIRFRTTAPLGPYEGLTVAVAWPKGVVAEPTSEERLGWWLQDNGPPAVGLLGLLGVLGYYFFAWRRAGRGPDAGTVVPIFSPPDGLSAAAVRFISKMGFDNRTFSAALVDCGVRGALRLREEEGGFFSSRKMTIEKRAGRDALPAPEGSMLEKLFAGGDSILMDNANHSTFGSAQMALAKGLKKAHEGTSFVRNTRYSLIGLGLVAAAVVAVAATISATGSGSFGAGVTTPAVGILSLVLGVWLIGWAKNAVSIGRCLIVLLVFLLFTIALFSGFITMVAAAESGRLLPMFVPLLALPVAISAFWWMAAPTRNGRALMDRIEGFRHYLSIAEEDRLEAMHPPEKTPELFERYLPYAIALKVENEWASRFTSVLAAAAAAAGNTQTMSWYSGDGNVWNDPDDFVDRVGSTLTSTVSSASTAPGSSSGSSGGGSSGGGGGGGGGGGW